MTVIDPVEGRREKRMIVVNFSHPLNDSQKQKIEELAQKPIQNVIDVPFQLDNNLSFVSQVVERIDTVGLSSKKWQTEPILVNPPAYAPAVAILLAELHGRMGYFPTILRVRPVPNSIPPSFEVAELVNLQVLQVKAGREQKRTFAVDRLLDIIQKEMGEWYSADIVHLPPHMLGWRRLRDRLP